MSGIYYLMLIFIIIGGIIFLTGTSGLLLKKNFKIKNAKKYNLIFTILFFVGLICLTPPFVYIANINDNPENNNMIYEESLECAASTGNYDLAKELLEKGTDVDATFLKSSKNTPLIGAVSSNDLKMTKLILEYNPNLEQLSDEGLTPLAISVINNNKEILDILLLKGADINSKMSDDATAVIKAANQSDTELLIYLEKNGADLKILNNQKQSALYFACNPSDVVVSLDLVKYLVNKNLDVNYKTSGGDNLIEIVKLNKARYIEFHAEDEDYNSEKVDKAYKDVVNYLKMKIK